MLNFVSVDVSGVKFLKVSLGLWRRELSSPLAFVGLRKGVGSLIDMINARSMSGFIFVRFCSFRSTLPF